MLKQDLITLMREKLTLSLHPTSLEIIDDSHKHIGHPGAKNGGHFTLIIAAECFENKNLIESHRLIYESLGDLVGTKIHALQIIIKHPSIRQLDK